VANELRNKYFIAPDAAALAERATREFVEAAQEAVAE
jgi:hypothetical protein